MKGRILVSFVMVTMALLMLSIRPVDKPQAQSQNSKKVAKSANQIDEINQFDASDTEDFQIVDVPMKKRSIVAKAAGPGNLVYAGDNISTGAGVRILHENGDGTLTDMPGSPVSTGGKGDFDVVGFNRVPTGIFAAVDIGPYEEDKDLILNEDGSRMFVCNQGTGDLSVFDVSTDGLKLTPVPGSPFKTGITPGSVTLAAFDTVIVLNKNDPAGNPKPPGKQASLVSFKMAANGSLTPVPNSTILLPTAVCGEGIVCGQTSSPSQVQATADGKIVFVCDFMGGFIRPYKVNPDGTLKATTPFNIRSLGEKELPVNGQTFPFPLNFGLSVNKNILYCGLPLDNKVGVFSYSVKSGKLKFIRTVPNSGLTVCWFYMKEDGKFFYTTNQVSNSVSTYDLTDPTNPKEVQLIKFKECGEPAQVEASPGEDFLYFIIQAATNRCSQKDPAVETNWVHSLRIGSDGMLTDLLANPLKLPVGERCQGIATK